MSASRCSWTFPIQTPERFGPLAPTYQMVARDPHDIVLFCLGIAALVCVVIAWFAILITGRYPRALFDFVVGVGRWSIRVQAYAFLLATDPLPAVLAKRVGKRYVGARICMRAAKAPDAASSSPQPSTTSSSYLLAKRNRAATNGGRLAPPFGPYTGAGSNFDHARADASASGSQLVRLGGRKS